MTAPAYDPARNSLESYNLAIQSMRVRHELLICAKEAAVILADIAKAANLSTRGAAFNRLMAAIKDFEEFEVKHYGGRA